MEHEAVGGILDSFIKSLLADAKFDYKAFLAHPKFREAIASLAVAVKDSASLPFGLDDKVVDQLVAALKLLLDQVKDTGPVTVGATPEPMEARKRRSKEEVEAELRKVGIDPFTIGSIIMMILQYAPDLIAMIKKLFGK